MNSSLGIDGQMQRVERNARIAQELTRAAESIVVCNGPIELALSNLMKAGSIFADCLNKLREATRSQEINISESEGTSDSTTDPLAVIFPGTFCYSNDLILFLSCSEVFHDYSTN